MPGFLVHRLSRDLDLDASQRERVESIARRTQEEMREARRQLRPRIEEIIEKGRGEIRAG